MTLGDSRIAAVVAVSDIDRAREFYEGKLGLRVGKGTTEAGLAYRLGEATELFLYLSPANAGSGDATVASFEVDNVELEVAELSAAGVEFERYDDPEFKTDEYGIASVGDDPVAWFKDPDGNIFAVTEL